ncbi:MAG: UDP-N-acetylmuramoyl-L-alanyl-D-glutamate--2,6-diaminopimelate ligase [Helicobacteraceae bacterium]|nr:UDP-N-acetylmuramoyl-L-alanyl-D-glutamate--2,6-diaminopimelate ligase [Helicobacteraceae bacterium]
MLYSANAPYGFITADSREVTENTAFVVDWYSQRFIDDAKKRGAKGILYAADLKAHFDIDLPIVGITGTNGKTTTAALIYSIMLDLGCKAAMQGTRGLFVNGQKRGEKHLTTPMLLDNYARIDQAKKEGCDFFITEVSSHAIAQKRLEEIGFALKIHTNITGDHLDFHRSFESYRDVKNSFFADGALKLINKDDPNVRFNIQNARTYAIDQNATFTLEAYSRHGTVSGVIAFAEERGVFHSTLIGYFNLYNILAAAAAVKLLTNRSLQDICGCIENFGGVKGRMQIVSEKPLVIVDFAHTADGIKQALSALEPNKLVAVFGAGGDRDRTKRPQMGREAARYARRIFLTSDNPRNEDPLAVINDIAAGCGDHGNLHIEPDRKEAIRKALASMENDEILIILGKGDETTQQIGDTLYPFSDEECVRELLKDCVC